MVYVGSCKLPKKINKTRIVLSKLDRQGTYLDQDFLEPCKKEFGIEIIVYGQINIFNDGKFEYLNRFNTGDREDTRGRITFLRRDLDKINVKINKGDKILRVGNVGCEIDFNARVIEVRPMVFRNGTNMTWQVSFTYDYDKKEGKL